MFNVRVAGGQLKKKRSNAFDLLCGLCILRMVMLHVVCQTQLRRESWWKETMLWTFFFMSFFFFKAGYFNKGITGETLPYLRDRIRRLLVPYFSWGLIGFVLAFFWLSLFPEGIAKAIGKVETFDWLGNGFTFGNGPLWFLLSFFTTYVMMHFIERVRHLHWVVLAFPAIGYWLFRQGNPVWFLLNNVFCGTFFFYMGKVWHHALDAMTRRQALLLSALLCAGFVFANIYLHGEYEMRVNGWVGPFWQVLLIMPLSLLGISGVLLSLPTPRVPVINYIGEHSMVFFVSHYPIVLSFAYASILLGHNIRGSIPDFLIILAVTFALCFLAVPYVERVPWLSGRNSLPRPLRRQGEASVCLAARPSSGGDGGGIGSVYFYHTQDTERIVREWRQGRFPSHFLYGVLQLPDHGIGVVLHHQRHTYRRLHDMLVATWKVLTCRQRYDVLYATHSLGIEPVILLRALRLYRHPIVVWHHQPVVRAKNPLREAVARLFYRGMDHMIFFSGRLMQDSLLPGKADPRRMSMVHWGADLEYYDSLPRPLQGRGERRQSTPSLEGMREAPFISTGKELRDFETLLQAFRETGLPLVLYAEKKRQAYFESLCPPENVELHYGDRPIPHEIAQAVARSRCVCVCCQRSNYTVGLTTVVEALALGLPILCTRNPQMPMDIEAEGCGFWIEEKDVEGWKEKLRYISSHPGEAKAMGQRGRALAQRYYNVVQCGQEVANIISHEI